MDATPPTMSANPSDDWGTIPKGRRTAYLIVLGVFAAVAGLGFFAIPSLITGWFEGGDMTIHRVHDLGWGALGGILVCGALLVQFWAWGRKPAALQQLAVVAIAFILGMGLASDYSGGVVGATALVVVGTLMLLWLHPRRLDVLRERANFNPALAGLVIVGAVPLIGYALTTSSFQRNGLPDDPHVSMHHWTTMTTMAIAIVLVGALASLRTDGWRIPAWSAGLALCVFGLASMIYPDYAGSAGSYWGGLALVGGLIFVLTSEILIRREREGVPT
jgi:MFS family permease